MMKIVETLKINDNQNLIKVLDEESNKIIYIVNNIWDSARDASLSVTVTDNIIKDDINISTDKNEDSLQMSHEEAELNVNYERDSKYIRDIIEFLPSGFTAKELARDCLSLSDKYKGILIDKVLKEMISNGELSICTAVPGGEEFFIKNNTRR